MVFELNSPGGDVWSQPGYVPPLKLSRCKTSGSQGPHLLGSVQLHRVLCRAAFRIHLWAEDRLPARPHLCRQRCWGTGSGSLKPPILSTQPTPIQINLSGLAETDSIIPNPGPKEPSQILGSLGHVLTVLKGKLAGCTWTIGPSFSTGKDGRSSFFVDKIQNQWVAYHVPAEYPRIAVG